MSSPAAPPRSNDLCWCGSGRKYKRCHKPLEGRVAARATSARCARARRHRAAAVRRDRRARPLGRAAGQVARDHRAHAPRRRRSPPRCCAWPASIVAPRHHHRRDRRLRPRALHRARRLPEPAQLQRLPEERLHLGQRGHLPRHPRHPGAARTATSSTSTSPSSSTASTATPTPRSSSATSTTRAASLVRVTEECMWKGIEAVRAGPAGQRHRPGHRGPRQGAPLRRGAGVHRPRHRRAVPHRPADPPLLRPERHARSCGRA